MSGHDSPLRPHGSPATRPNPVVAGRAFVEGHFPECRAAFVAGSFLRGEATPTSDLDIVVVDDLADAPFRASYHEFGWPIEAFVHTVESCRWYFVNDGRRPSLAMMCHEGEVVRDREGFAGHIRAEARELLTAGPRPLSPEELASWRYGLTDALDDFVGCDREDEGVFIASIVAQEATDLVLLLNRQWLGAGKWTPRALRRFDPELAERLGTALTAYTRHGDKGELIAFATAALDMTGGRLFQGYYSRGHVPQPADGAHRASSS